MSGPISIRQILSVALLGLAGIVSGCSLNAIALTHVNIVNVVSGTVDHDMTLVVADGIIQSVEHGSASIPAGAYVASLEGLYLLPGLIDAHVHLADTTAASDALSKGITTVRNLGSHEYADVEIRTISTLDPGRYPEIQAAGYHIYRTLPDALVALNSELKDLQRMGVEGPESFRRVTRVLLAHQVDNIKLGGERRISPAPSPSIWQRAGERLRQMFRGLDTVPKPLDSFGPGPGFESPWTVAEYRAVVELARQAGVGVAVHAFSDQSARTATLAGVNSIEHGTFITDPTLILMADQQVSLVPMLGRSEWRGHGYVDRVRAVVRQAYHRGVNIVAGTDGSYADSAPPLSGELQALERAGLPRAVALQAATINAAKLLGIDDRTGRVAPGYEADLLVVETNPLDDLSTLENPILIVNNGVVARKRREGAAPATVLATEPPRFVWARALSVPDVPYR